MAERQVNLAYYRPEDWGRLLSIVDDGQGLQDTRKEWYQKYLSTMTQLKSMGLHVN